ncbi:hypothetical protein TIFTF001_039114 [Ficus carica]|uniref:Uncharacterized protein n=1 Tax=Ficus carica TaxID=3494 RepID=A0AA88JDS5_FICCA|nr:hypothetical protein TIFTF001_039114 [Ficus carica]
MTSPDLTGGRESLSANSLDGQSTSEWTRKKGCLGATPQIGRLRIRRGSLLCLHTRLPFPKSYAGPPTNSLRLEGFIAQKGRDAGSRRGKPNECQVSEKLIPTIDLIEPNGYCSTALKLTEPNSRYCTLFKSIRPVLLERPLTWQLTRLNGTQIGGDFSDEFHSFGQDRPIS